MESSSTVKGLSHLLAQLRKAPEVKCLVEQSLHGGLEKSLCEAVKIKARLGLSGPKGTIV